MLSCFFTGADGRAYPLPPPASWRISLGCGEPCDAFELCCAVGESPDWSLSELAGFYALWNGERVFTGLVDELELEVSAAGRLLRASGRGMAARLMDNECPAARYGVATLEDILADHVTPLGVELASAEKMPPVAGYGVGTGASRYEALAGFTRFSAGISPRFDSFGRLILRPEGWGGRSLYMGAGTAYTSLRYTCRRYGVLSAVTVTDSSAGRTVRAENEAFIALGGRAERFSRTALKNSYKDLEYLTDYQLRESRRDASVLELTLPGAFSAAPGDRVSSQLPGASGAFIVSGAETECSGGGISCRLTMRETE